LREVITIDPKKLISKPNKLGYQFAFMTSLLSNPVPFRVELNISEFP
jgi:hypothetical protein